MDLARGIIGVDHGLNRRGEPAEDRSYSPEWETKTAISQILGIVLKPIGFTQQLEEMLDVIVSISWLNAEKKGGIIVANSRKELVLTVHHNLDPQLVKQCSLVKFGQTLCGKAALEKRVLFKAGVEHDLETPFPSIKGLGSYNIPLLGKDSEVIGVVVLYVEHKHRQHSEEEHFITMLGQTLSNVIFNRNLQIRSEISSIRLQKAHQEMIHKLVAASELRDNETGAHIKRPCLYAEVVGRGIGLSEKEVNLLTQAIPMHDVGKIGIPDAILLKPGKLTQEEFLVIQQHTTIGANILSGDHPLILASQKIALSHHEKWDGSGYPQGLAGEKIPLFARVCALVDVFDALMSERPYKEPWPLEKVLALIKEEVGSHFDPHVVDSFMQNLPEILDIKRCYSDSNGEAGEVATLWRKEMLSSSSTWENEYSIGIDSIDEQHEYLFSLLAQVSTMADENDSERIYDAILDMKRYTEVHFFEEELLMRLSGYQELEQHIKQHRRFIKTADNFIDDLEKFPLAAIAEMSAYLSNWLISHIQVSDRRYGEYKCEMDRSTFSAIPE